jgi:hypothetical protein
MLWTVFVILAVLWLLGIVTAYTRVRDMFVELRRPGIPNSRGICR